MTYRARVACVWLLGFFIDLVNMFIASVAYPEIGRYFQVSVSQLTWISNSYILGLTLVIPLSRWLTHRLGARRLFRLSLVLFIIASCGVSASDTFSWLIICRGLQGAGGGLLIPVGQAMTFALYQNHERAKLSSVIMLVALLAPALAPVTGGLLVDSVSWRGIFVISLPLALAALFLAGRWLNPDEVKRSPGPLDICGLLSGCSALTLILLGLTGLGEMDKLMQGTMMLLTGLVILAGYIRGALKKSQPLINLALARDRCLHTAMLVYQFIPGVFTGVNLVAMIYFQSLLSMPASLVGALMIPWSLASFVAIRLTGRTFNRLGPRPLFIVGCLTQGAGIALLALCVPDSALATGCLAFILMGFGGSLCSSTAQSTAFMQIADCQLADASALWNINRQLSFCLGVTLVGLAFSLMLNSGIPKATAWHIGFGLVACSALIPALISLRLPNNKIITALNKEQQ